MPVEPAINRLTGTIINRAMTVHRALGLGLLESAYFACLVVELRSSGLRVDVDVKVPLVYRGLKLCASVFLFVSVTSSCP
jgi:GxxExxY protein